MHRMGVVDLAGLVRSGAVSARAVASVFLERINRHNPQLNAFVYVDAVSALAQAEAIDRIVASGRDPGPLAGVPVGVKDLEDVAGMPTRSGSLLTGKAPAAADSTQVARMRAAGAVMVGKTATPEFGSLVYTWSQLHGVTRNPWNLQQTPGGSSGGSAAAVAAGLVPLATASDGGGSIRIPAGYCSLAGFKTTNGLVPRGPRRNSAGNLIAFGPLTASVRDLARVLDQVAGDDPSDPLSFPKPARAFEQSLGELPENLSFAWSTSLGFGGCEGEVAGIARAAAERFAAATGAREAQVKMRLPDAGEDWVHMWAMNAYTDLAHLSEVKRQRLTPVMAEALDVATMAGPENSRAAVRRSFGVLRKVNQVFDQVDLILTPTMPIGAFSAEGPMPRTVNLKDLPVLHRRIDPPQGVCFTFPFNLTGQPAISLPAGVDSNGVPVGLQVVAPRFADARLLAAAFAYEGAETWPKVCPGYWD